MWNEILDALGAGRYSAHALCLTADPILMFLYVMSDFSTFLAYFTIGIVMLTARTIPQTMRPEIRILYGAFIFLCGLSHLTMVMTLFAGVYRLDIFIRAAMAGVSVVTATVVLNDFVFARWAKKGS